MSSPSSLLLLKRTLSSSSLSVACRSLLQQQQQQCSSRVSNRYYIRSVSTCNNNINATIDYGFPTVDNNATVPHSSCTTTATKKNNNAIMQKGNNFEQQQQQRYIGTFVQSKLNSVPCQQEQLQQQFQFQQIRQHSSYSNNNSNDDNNNNNKQDEITNTNSTTTTNTNNTINTTKLLNLPMYKKIGTVIRFDNRLGYGYIKPDDSSETGGEHLDIFFHYTKIQMHNGGYCTMNRGQRVEYDSFQNDKGYTAIYVKALEGSTSLSPSQYVFKKKQQNIMKQRNQQQGIDNPERQERWTSYGRVENVDRLGSGYGYIRQMEITTMNYHSYNSYQDVFFHFTHIVDDAGEGYRTLEEGDYVRYDAFINDRGPTASKVYPVTEDDYYQYKNSIATMKPLDNGIASSAGYGATSSAGYGTVVFVREDHGTYGYLRPDDGSPDVFFHLSRIQPIEGSNIQTTVVGQRVQYEARTNSRGPTAIIVILLNDK